MTRWNYLAVALMLGASALVGCNKDESGKTPGQKAGEAVQKGVDTVNEGAKKAADSASAAIQGISADKLENVRDVVASVVNNALSRNDFKDISANFPNDAQKRVDSTKPDTKDLDDLADSIGNAWKDKYKNSFKVKDLGNTYDASFMTLAKAESATTAPSTSTVNVGNSSQRATATIAASHGLPELTVPFVEESKKWKLQVPDTLDGAKLHDNLKAALTDISDKSKWPDSEQEAYRFVTHRILMAALDKS